MSRQVSPYPLDWPLGQVRTPEHKRKSARFGRMAEKEFTRGDGSRSSYKQKKRWTFGQTRDDLLVELERMQATHVVMSTNVKLRNDGLPFASAREPDDPGIAVYFRRFIAGEKRPFAMACDTYDRLADNARALTLTIEALRKIERHGSSALMEQAFSGFSALPPARTGVRPWREVLKVGTGERCTLDEADNRYRTLLKTLHPDRGGSAEQMAELNDAIRRAREELAP